MSTENTTTGTEQKKCVTSLRTKRLFIAFAAVSIAAITMVFHLT
jgi:hypothetical protein